MEQKELLRSAGRVITNVLAGIGAVSIVGAALVAILMVIDRAVAAPKPPVVMHCYPRPSR